MRDGLSKKSRANKTARFLFRIEKSLMLGSNDTTDITDIPIHVAVIDDSMADAHFLERLLTNLSGWKIDTTIYDSSNDAFIHLKEAPPDVLIVDYLLGLGRMTGIEVMERFPVQQGKYREISEIRPVSPKYPVAMPRNLWV